MDAILRYCKSKLFLIFPLTKYRPTTWLKIPELLNQTHNSVRFETWNKDDNCSTTNEEINLEEVDAFFDDFINSCPSSSPPPSSKKMKKQAKDESTQEELLKEAKPDKLKEEPPQARQKTSKQKDSTEDDGDFQAKGKDEGICKSVSQNTVGDLCYRLKNSKKNNNFKEEDGKIKCPFCRICIKNIQIHFQRKSECGAQIDMGHFNIVHEEFRKENIRRRKTQNKQEQREKQKKVALESFREKQNKQKANNRQKHKQKIQLLSEKIKQNKRNK